MTSPLFISHRLNEGGLKLARDIGDDFDALLLKLNALSALDGREGAIVKTKLEEACFFAKKAISIRHENQEHE